MKPKIGITVGDINGIGPEIILKSLPEFDPEESTPILIGPRLVFEHYSELLHLDLNTEIWEPQTAASKDLMAGTISQVSGSIAMSAIEHAVDACLENTLQGMVTAPISKEAVNMAGYKIPGHTEFIAERTKADSVLMMLVSEDLRVALATVHVPLSQVVSGINAKHLTTCISTLNKSLQSDFMIEEPRIAVLGLNPHAGDGGVIGSEEEKIIKPLIKELRESVPGVMGPFPADAFFGQKSYEHFDAVLAMYHDQGLAPFKLISFGSGVNFSAGLPIIRTSPDHGTAFDIAGKGIADPSSLIKAYKLAAELAHKRSRS